MIKTVISGCLCLMAAIGAVAEPVTSKILTMGFNNQTPYLNGLNITSQGMELGKAKAGSGLFAGKDIPAWQISRGFGAKCWERIIDLQITVPELLNGKHQAIDVSVTWRMPTTACLRLYVMTKDGFKQYSDEWAGNKDIWRETTIRVDDALIQKGKPVLRIGGANGTLSVHSVTVKVYNIDREIDWSRMIRIADIRNNMPQNVQFYRRSADNHLEFMLNNLTQQPCKLNYRLTYGDLKNPVANNKTGEINLPPSNVTPLHFDLDTTAWALGPSTATLELFDGTILRASTVVHLGVISDTTLSKAGDNEFFYGLDLGHVDAEKSEPYYDMMGVDITRCPVGISGRVMDWARIDKAMDFMKRNRLRSAYAMDPVVGNDKLESEVIKFLQELIVKYGGRGYGQVSYLEFGNEPDLPDFFNHPAQEYPVAMKRLLLPCREAIAKAGLNGKVKLMNGGLSFAHEYGNRRSREILKCSEMRDLDIIAYHGHGLGIEAERTAYLRIKQAAAEGGISGKPFVETESGFSGIGETGMTMQARTVVQKMTYVQSIGDVPTFYSFRFFFPNGNPNEAGYSMTENDVRQPRPSIFAYRTMVENLRHYKFVKSLDFDKIVETKGISAFLFAESDEQQKSTGNKTLVLFCEKPQEYNLSARLAGTTETISPVSVSDMYGNVTELKIASGNITTVNVGPDPIYLKWQSSGGGDSVQVEKTVLNAPSTLILPSGADVILPFRVSNTSENAQATKVEIIGRARGGLQIGKSRFDLNTAPGQTNNLTVTLNCGFSRIPLEMPSRWQVFLDADPDKVSDWSQIPATLTNPVIMDAVGTGTLNFGKIAPHREFRPAIGFAWLEASEDCLMPIAASSDWWMAWYVNGKQVYSTLKTGNCGSPSSLIHQFDLPLKKGRNLIAFQCKSGRSNWLLQYGGPKERAIELSSGKDNPDSLVIILKDQNNVELERKTVSLLRHNPVESVEASTLRQPTAWNNIASLFKINPADVNNCWVAKPDTSKWYGGKADFSGECFAAADADNFYLAALIADANHCPTGNGSEPVDSLEITVVSAQGKTIFQKCWSTVTAGKSQNVEYQAARLDNGRTFYLLKMPRKMFPQPSFRIAATIFDNDGGNIGYRQKAVFGSQWLSLRP